MSQALALKELREHRWILLASWLLFFAALGVSVWREDSGGPLVPYRQIALGMSMILGLVCANRLVVREYTSRTQLFLEALPVTRARVLGTKWIVGALWLALPLLFGLVGLVALRSETAQVDVEAAVSMGVRTLAFAWCWYALAFLVGLLGRYRFMIWAALMFGVYLLDTYAQLEPTELVPFALVQPDMVVETTAFPVATLVWTIVVTVLLLATSAFVALGGEGGWVMALSHRMSHREKVGFAVALAVPLVVMQMLDARKQKPKFDLVQAVRTSDRELVVGIARPDDLPEQQARELSATLAADVGSMAQWLKLESVPAVFVLPDASIDGDVFLRAELPAADGVVLRGALGAPAFDLLGFRAYAVQQVLVWYTRGRALSEPRRWLLDGFAWWWVTRADPKAQELLEARARSAGALEANALSRWSSVSEQLGDCVADAVAFTAVRELMRSSPATAEPALREVLGTRPPDDVRGWLKERPITALVDVASLEAKLPRGAAPTAQLELRANRLGGDQYEVRFEPSGLPGSFAVRWATLGPWAGAVERAELLRFDARGAGVLPLTVPAGTRLFAAAEVFDDELACTRRVAAKRWEVR